MTVSSYATSKAVTKPDPSTGQRVTHKPRPTPVHALSGQCDVLHQSLQNMLSFYYAACIDLSRSISHDFTLDGKLRPAPRKLGQLDLVYLYMHISQANQALLFCLVSSFCIC